VAVYPCTIGQHRYGGAQRSIYLTRLDGARPETRKFRLCSRHFAELQGAVARAMTLLEDDSQASPFCDRCGESRATVVFARNYSGGDEPDQYAVDVCRACEAAVLSECLWAQGAPL
jgi:hypothetical protein